jgi:hypothetical protein
MTQDSKAEIASEISEQELDSVQGGLTIIRPPFDDIIVRPLPPHRPWPLRPPVRPIPIRPVPRPLPDPPPFIDIRPLIS